MTEFCYKRVAMFEQVSLSILNLKIFNQLMFLGSVKELRLTSKGMSNICLNSSYREKLTFSKAPISKFKKFFSRSVFGELQLRQYY